ncbi:DNA/RNA non-specific endonuclease [Mucilaginibacter sp. HMF5004]|uniref:DNA/RNA non-specific endonuclease n=1 Tax=Mucilaginibacter rivuli TaxID=2857527 RepID=UPI001C5D227D|nr:DNA/RNA non-specific endonuclease [Mucilaginibacter rivuli]MBW4889501.1 DNA/RNA non-specific endonuclease [Mucilaginibacter rivuli]
MKLKKLLVYSLSAAMLASCTKQVADQVSPDQATSTKFSISNISNSFAVTQTFDEGFESGTKTAYAVGNVTFGSGSWSLDDALVGTSTSDAKVGSQSVRIRNTGIVKMNFDVTTGSSTVTVKHALYGSDASSTWNLLVSANGGSTYTQVGSTVTTSSTTIATATFTVNLAGNLRFEIVKASGGTNRINIDEFTVNSYDSGSGGGGGGGTTGDNSNMLLGNPSGATTSVTTSYNNYLYDHTYYIDSYNRDKGEPNWTSWYVGPTSLGSAARQDDFRADTALPTGWYEVGSTSYSGSGFDRGHNCPSADRTSTVAANSATFLMDNMIPQAPNNNQQTWANFENYTRSLVTAGNEVYVIMGSYGSGGTGSAGTATTINSGHVAVPARIWKVVVVIPNGNSDLSRITSTTRVISIDTPNINTINSDWTQYITTVKAIETATGYTLLGAVPSAIRTVLENEKDSGTGTL